ncbi:MAG: F0F1 ATP synthase subunit delta [Planctomycetaceae bacterium]
MQIDWFTSAAQVVNFLVLVWLLKRFLYGPILNAIDERERRIADRLQSAKDREAAADEARKSYETREAELAHLKETKVSEAAAEVESWKREALQSVREEVGRVRQAWHEAIAREQQQFLGELRERTAHEVQQLARHVLRELADQQMELQTIQQFLTHLDRQSEDELTKTRNGRPAGEVVLRTAFALAADDQATLSDEVQGRLGATTVRFEVDSELICGVELVVGDHKLQWNVDHYLRALESSVVAAIEKRAALLPPSEGNRP